VRGRGWRGVRGRRRRIRQRLGEFGEPPHAEKPAEGTGELAVLAIEQVELEKGRPLTGVGRHPAQDVRPRIEPVIDPAVAALQRRGRHPAGREDRVRGVVPAQVAVQDAALALQPVVQPRAGVGGHDVRRHRGHALPHQPVQRGREHRFIVAVEAEDEAGVDHDAAVVDARDGLVVPLDPVRRLAAAEQVVGVDAFEADEEALAAGLGHQIEQILAAADVGRDRGVPGQLQRAERMHQFARPLRIADEVVVDEHHVGHAEEPDLLEDMRQRFHPVARVDMGRAVVAEIAPPGTAASDAEGVGEKIALCPQQLPSGGGGEGDVHRALVAIKRAQRAAPVVLEQPRPELLRLADHDRVGVGRAVVRADGGVDAAHDHGDAAPPVGARDLRGAVNRVHLHRQPDQVGRIIEPDALDVLVGQAHLVLARGQCAEDQQREGRGHARLPVRIHRPLGRSWRDEFYVHAGTSVRAPIGVTSSHFTFE
jgi:hypothetical protein